MQSISTRIVRTALAGTAALAMAAPAFGAVWVGGTETELGSGIYSWGMAENWNPSGVPADDVENDFNALDGGSYTVDLGGGTQKTAALRFGNDNPQKYVFTNGIVEANRSSGATLLNLRSNNQVEIEDLILAGGPTNSAALVDGNASSKLFLTGTVNSEEVNYLLEVRNVGVQLDGTWTTAAFSLSRNAHMVVNGTLNATQYGSGSIALSGVSGTDTNNTTVTLELGENAQFNVASINVDTRLNANSSDTARIRLSEGVESKTLDSTLTFTGSGNSDWQVEFDGTGGDIIFDSDWTVTAGSNTNTARVAIGAGRTITVLGNFTQNNAQGVKSLALSGGGTLVHGDSLADEYQLKGGGITITDATFILNSTMTEEGAAINVNAAGTLGGSGIINRNVNVAEGGTLAPGQSPGTLNITGVLTLADGFILDWEYGELANDLIDIIGTLDLTDANTIASTVNLIDAGGAIGNGDVLFATSGGITGASHGTVLNWTITGGGDLYQAMVDGNNVVLTIIPEPATLVLALAGGLLILPTRRGRAADAA